ncbi:MAG: hypothetical protein RR215_05850 [Ruthenibacterium sp.]
MKKLLILILAGALALSLAACGGSTADNAVSAPAEDAAKEGSTSYFGKISSVAGNEIEINLAKEPEMPEQTESAPQEKGETVAAATMTPATTTGQTDGGAANRVEVEYTGEMKAFVLPAGMSIQDAVGNEKQLSDIKKGSIMNIFADENGNVTEAFLYE